MYQKLTPAVFRSAAQFKLTGGIIFLLESWYGTAAQDAKLDALRRLPDGTTGREVVRLLDEKGYRLIPKFESHDLKHLILGYEMTMKDEIRMQGYLIGNGNRTWPCLLFFMLGVFYPGVWMQLYREFRKGRNRKSIHFLTIENCMHENLCDLQNHYTATI